MALESALAIDPKLIVTTDELPGYLILKTLGTVEGIGVRSFAGFTPEGRKERLQDGLREAYHDMIAKASAQRAQAIVGLRYILSPEQGVFLVYGTAVTVQRA